MLSLSSCSLIIKTVPDETLIAGVWSGWKIVAEGMVFRTPVGIKTINYPVQILQHNEQWFIWENGYDMEIYYEGEK